MNEGMIWRKECQMWINEQLFKDGQWRKYDDKQSTNKYKNSRGATCISQNNNTSSPKQTINHLNPSTT